MDVPGFKFECRFCHQRIEVPSDMRGQIIDCPKCGKAIVVPAAESDHQDFRAQDKVAGLVQPAAPEPKRRCPFCSEEILAAAKKCRHCGEFVKGIQAKLAPGGVGPDYEKQIMVLGGVVCLLIGIVLHSRGLAVSTFGPLYALSMLLGIASILQKQILAGAIVLVAALIVPFTLRSGSPQSRADRNRPRPVPAPSRESLHPTVPQPSPPSTPQPTASTTQPTLSWPPPADPFQTALGPGTTPESSQTPSEAPPPKTTKPDESSPAAELTEPPKPQPAAEEGTALAELTKDPANKELFAKLRFEIRAMPEGDQKVKLMTIYGLGCLFTGKAEEGIAVRSYLAKHFPNNPHVKGFSVESVSDSCSVCHGAGSAARDCPECGGNTMCSRCNGSGTRSLAGMNGTAKTVKCVSCEGSGKCRRCKGSGQIKPICQACGGKKTKLSEAKIREHYLSLLGVPLSSGPATPTLQPAANPPAETPPAREPPSAESP